MKHNVYDFDKTIYKDDSALDFYLFCLSKHPGILAEIPVTAIYGVLYLFKLCSKTTLKEKFYRFLRHVDSVDDLLMQFWSVNQAKIKDFYIGQHNENDIIISASPEFVLKPICKSLHINNLIASKVNQRTGLYDGENCWGEEKLKRFRDEMPNAEINEFYSDSLSDSPLAKIAEKAYVVRKDEIILWSDYRPSFIHNRPKIY
ncbi:MAG: haloacid dehalogenase-like hydrolase [Bacillota bacterium]